MPSPGVQRDVEEANPSITASELKVGRFRLGPSLLVRVALIATALAYVQAITYAFVFDDLLQIEMNPWIQSWKHWREFFTGHVWSFGRAHVLGNYYRPTFMFWLAGNYSLFKLTPGWWHLTSIAAHLVATALVFALGSRLLNDRWAAGVAALLFGLYPLHIESVAWVSGVPEVLLTIFFLGAWLACMRARETKSVAWTCVALVLYALALLSKETAVAFLPVLAVWWWTSTETQKMRQVLLRVAPFLVVTALYLVVRQQVLGGVAVSNYPRPTMWVVATWPPALWFYLRQMWWPFRLSLFYDVELQQGFSAMTLVWLALAGIATAAFAWLGRVGKLGWLTAVGVLAPLAPVLVGIRVFQWHDYVHDRYAYLPSVMVAIAIAAALKRLADSGSRRTLVTVTALLALAFGWSTVTQSRQWESDLALFSHAKERAPENPLPRDYLGRTLFGLGRTEEAVAEYQELLRRDPQYWQANYILGLAYYQAGQYDEAEKYLLTATQVWPREFIRPDAPQFYYLGLLQQRKGKLAEAEASLRRAVELRPEAPGYRYGLGAVLKAQGRAAEAEEQMRIDVENRKAAAERQK